MKTFFALALLFFTNIAFSQQWHFPNTDFSRADSIALSYRGHDLKDPDALARLLVKDLHSEPEKFRAIFRWITDNIAYDNQLYQQIIKKEAKLKARRKKMSSALSRRLSKKLYRRMILQQKTVCGGYAMLLEYMCSVVDIQCEFVSGHGRDFDVETGTPNHAWNAVKLDDHWFLCDVTWASGYVRDERFIKAFDEAYFLTEPSLLIANHYPSEKNWTLLKDSPSLQDFFQSVFKSHGFISNRINHYFPETQMVRVKMGQPFELRFTSNAENIDKTVGLVFTKPGDKKYHMSFSIESTRNPEGEYVVSKENLNAGGTYLVYVYINDVLTFVYKVVVVR